MIVSFASLFIFTFFVKNVFAGYYVDLSLNTDGEGIESNPWQWSQAKDRSNVHPGDILYFRGDISNEVTLTTDSDANGDYENQLIFKQWVGEKEAKFISINFNGTSVPYYSVDGITIDAGIGESWVAAINESWSGSGGKLEFINCLILGHRSSLFTSGDYYPYYVAHLSVFENIYVVSMNGVSGLDLKFDGCRFEHGWRVLRLTGMLEGSVVITNSTFDRIGEDAINIPTASNVLISSNRFAENFPVSTNYASWYWPGNFTGTWTNFVGETITQDSTGASGIYTGEYRERMYIVVDDSTAIPSRTSQEVWRLDSDPDNYYFTPSGGGDNAHNDMVSVEGGSHDIIIEKNIFDGRTNSKGQAIKFNSSVLHDIVFRNNIIKKWNSGYMLLMEKTGNDIYIINNIFDPINNDVYTLRTMSGTANVFNNIFKGGQNTGGVITSDYNIYTSSVPAWVGGDHNLVNQDLNDASAGDRYFMNYSEGDYRPFNSNSPNIDMGVVLHNSIDDFDGKIRSLYGGYDIGPYEYEEGSINQIIRFDVDYNFIINTIDSILTLRNSLGLDMSQTNWQNLAITGDTNCDGDSNSIDAVLLLRYSLGLDMSGTDWCEF